MASFAKLKNLVDALVSSCGDSEQSLEDCVSGLEIFFGNIESHPSLKKALESPVIKPEEKILIVKDICTARGFPAILQNFLAAVAGFDRLKPLYARRREVLEKLRASSGSVRAAVTVARPMSTEDEHRVRDAVSLLAQGRKSEVEFTEDSEIIGGIIVRIGNSVYDDSVKTHLAKMSALLSK